MFRAQLARSPSSFEARGSQQHGLSSFASHVWCEAWCAIPHAANRFHAEYFSARLYMGHHITPPYLTRPIHSRVSECGWRKAPATSAHACALGITSHRFASKSAVEKGCGTQHAACDEAVAVLPVMVVVVVSVVAVRVGFVAGEVQVGRIVDLINFQYTCVRTEST